MSRNLAHEFGRIYILQVDGKFQVFILNLWLTTIKIAKPNNFSFFFLLLFLAMLIKYIFILNYRGLETINVLIIDRLFLF